ncbi:TetR/AcrR family transcriptional regulator [Agrococcus carbonis]|uniref:DNA-binding transcriptional regulator, AcrR family n=1 Tax=Agrococcus carbonis TaxID=684552 RepID=A0A1H1N738_9MICO|nr:TetR/AcrR family transcriptional regulator [Agrococcus carbonis]SDR94700.1 DNA-binding transcriptional regulator, AcrR family [Agrococcus carbonis]
MARPNLSRAKVLDAAAELAASGGVSATTVDDIAAAAGVAKGSVYYSFASKEQLFETLIEESVTRLAERLGESVAEALPGEGRPAARALARAFLHAVEERPLRTKVVFAELLRTDRPWSETLGGHRTTVLSRISDALRRDGSPASPLHASAFFGALVMVAFERLVFEPGLTVEAAVDAVVG